MFNSVDPIDLKPFEICSIRPPTENASLTFRLTRNCHWNRCAFCPVYKLGARYSRRTIEEVKEDIRRAAALDDFMFSRGIGNPVYSTADFDRAASLAEKVRRIHWEAGIVHDEGHEIDTAGIIDERMRWFLGWFNSRPGIGGCMNHIVQWRIGGGRTCFLGDADSLTLKPEFLEKALTAVKSSFPTLDRFTVYGRTSSAARLRSARDLSRIAAAGVSRIHFGLESGSDAVLALVNKGVTHREHVEGCRRVKDAGISCSLYVMPGLGGSRLSEEHAAETAKAITSIAPDYVRLRTLEVFPMTDLDAAKKLGEFIEAPEETVVKEIRTMIEGIECPATIVSDSATNLLEIHGSLPEDREAMLAVLDGYLALDPRKKLEFSFMARLRSFLGQYGDLIGEIHDMIRPHIASGGIDLRRASDREIMCMIEKIRSLLMP